jgi:hypothetical protein
VDALVDQDDFYLPGGNLGLVTHIVVQQDPS